MVKTVAIIGAGISGLASIRCCLEEGLEPTCFERSKDVGGLWQFSDQVEENRASIYPSLFTNSSKEMMCFPDFPYPDDYPNFMHHSKVQEYIKTFAQKKDLLKYIQFETLVSRVKKCPNFLLTGQWEVVVEKDGKTESIIFDVVMICSGHHIYPHLPKNPFPGLDKFQGHCFHSRDFKDPGAFKGKRVLIIGLGNSASDIAVELSRLAAQGRGTDTSTPRQETMTKKVAVIGAGVSGLISLKCCVDEGLEPTCFERTEDIGGLWRFKENVEDGRASIYQSVITNTSKEMSCFSDFPMPEDFPNFMHNSKLLEYFRIFAKNFDLLKYIQFQTTVLSVKKRPDFSSSGQWEVVTETRGKEQSAVFDAVMVCNGHHIVPRIPLESFPGIERFKGQYFHSRQYKRPEGFEGKRILVIGLGNSAADIAVELSKRAAQVLISTRHGSWIMSRVSECGYPWDMVTHTQFNATLQNVLPRTLLKWMVERQINQWFNHENYGLVPQNNFRNLMKEWVVNDDLPSRILYGAIKVKTKVRELTDTAAIFDDGTVEEDIDVIVFATGYAPSFPFLEDSLIKVEDNMVSLYKYVFPPHLERSTLACIGLIQTLGSIFPAAELQARWVTRVFKGLCTLPSERTMMADNIRRCQKRIDLFGKSPSQILQANYTEYLDELALEIGAKPNLLSLFFQDPKLAVKVYFGPCNSYHYRLVGPGRWEGARSAILTQKQRILKPLKTRTLEPSVSLPLSFLLKILGLLAVVLAFVIQLQWL